MRFHLLAAAPALSLVLSAPAVAADAHAHEGHLGKVDFANSCDAKVQPELQRAVAMLHSFWYSAGEKAFRKVLADDPTCAIATWGIAALLMNNPLAGQGASPQAAETAMAAIEQGRRIGAKTQRERDYIEAVAAYYADFASSRRAGSPARALAGLRGPGGEVSRRRRGADLRRAVRGRNAGAGRPDVRRVPQGGAACSRSCSSSIPTIPAWPTT